MQLGNPRSSCFCSSCLGLESKSKQESLTLEEMPPPFRCLQNFQRLRAEEGWMHSTASPQLPEYLEEWSPFISSS